MPSFVNRLAIVIFMAQLAQFKDQTREHRARHGRRLADERL
jgi:hypothetical protein